ncbi:MAG: hypothetical protein IJ367_01925 [Clostridia bacterium]|nr:hypothetical protein [Clostridia bacterium]
MKAIICILPKPKRIVSLCKLIFSPVVTCQTATVGETGVCVYALNPLKKYRLQKTVSTLLKSQPDLLFDDSLKLYPKLYRKPPLEAIFLRHLDKILACYCGGKLIYPAMISPEEDSRVMTAMEVLSHHAKAVTLCTKDSLWFDRISREALNQFGLSVTQRCYVIRSDFTLRFSKDDLQILDFGSENCLIDFSNPSVTEFFKNFSYLHFPHCCLLSETEKIQKLIWKIQKKS